MSSLIFFQRNSFICLLDRNTVILLQRDSLNKELKKRIIVMMITVSVSIIT